MNRFLIDTHVLIWWLEDSKKLSDVYRQIIENNDNNIEVSISSFYEIAIKVSIGKLGFDYDFKNLLEENNFALLNINFHHLKELTELPLHHKDPFDRMIISQAKYENLPILTSDQHFNLYEVTIV